MVLSCINTATRTRALSLQNDAHGESDKAYYFTCTILTTSTYVVPCCLQSARLKQEHTLMEMHLVPVP